VGLQRVHPALAMLVRRAARTPRAVAGQAPQQVRDLREPLDGSSVMI
jgi:hypothetical protein